MAASDVYGGGGGALARGAVGISGFAFGCAFGFAFGFAIGFVRW